MKPVIYQPMPDSAGDYTVAYTLLLSVISFLELRYELYARAENTRTHTLRTRTC